jgi:pimeloyl-ACP methyl ester carboxylesterase
VYGDADWNSHVLVLGPVNPVWHGGDFCRPLLDFFSCRKQRVFVLDTISFIEEGNFADEGEACIQNLARFIQNNLPKIDLIAGYALGGTVALKLARHLPETAKILCLSGPGFIDEALRGKLQTLLDLLVKEDLEGCLASLSALVAPLGKAPGIRHLDRIAQHDVPLGCRRVLAGFGLLLSLDARPGLEDYRGKVMCMLGEHSQLATTANLAIRPTSADSHRRLALVPDAGMRILLDNEEFTLSTINEWLEDGE